MKTFKIIGVCLLTILIILSGVIVWGSFFMLDVSLGDLSGKDPDWRRNDVKEQHPDTYQWADSLMRAQVMRDTMMTTHDGRRLHAWYAAAEDSTDTTVVLLHGYTCNAWTMMNIARMMRERIGMNIFLPEMHGHGQSDGDKVQMGWKDAHDVLEWMPIVTHLFGDSARSRIVIQGVSMGAATAMNISGMEHSPQIVGFIEDCGYSSVWEELSGELKKQYGLGEFPMMYTSSLLCRLKYGWSFGEASSLEMVRRCKKPMLFIHGSDDDFVPTQMVYALYEAKPQPKSLWIAEGSGHAASFTDHPEEYERQVREFNSQLTIHNRLKIEK